MNEAGLCFDHYVKYFNQPTKTYKFQTGEGSVVQILQFENVFEDCAVLTSLGFSHFSLDHSKVFQEVVMVVDKAWEESAEILAKTLLYIGEFRGSVDYGMSKAGIRDIAPGFYSRYSKDALYFTSPFALPEEFNKVNGLKSDLLMGMLISYKEHEFIKSKGFYEFEVLLEKHKADPLDIRRESVVD